MNNYPSISVVMPAYNHEEFVAESIESVLTQSFGDFEFIIINDGSTDGTGDVIKRYTDPRIRYYSHDNIDAPRTINRALSMTRGKYISIINSDDVYHKDRLLYLFNIAEEESLKFLFTDVYFIDENSKPLNCDQSIRIWHEKMKRMYEGNGSLKKVFLRSNIAVSSSNLFFSGSVPGEIGGFKNYRYVHDYDFIFRGICRYGSKFRFLSDKKYLYYRLHGNNTINKSFMMKNVEDFFVHMVNTFRLFTS